MRYLLRLISVAMYVASGVSLGVLWSLYGERLESWYLILPDITYVVFGGVSVALGALLRYVAGRLEDSTTEFKEKGLIRV